ncbi:MAG: hypothetical protein P1U74_00915 [Legionellaceae bacterium]|nr:hypothetical protein [Legionellaceae bacterium]
MDSWIYKNKFIPFLLCLSLATVLFYPLFLGKFTIAGTDLLFSHYPNLIFGHRSFHDFGRFALWNPYMFLGGDFSQSMHAHYLNPLYWPFMLLPEKYLLYYITCLHYFMNAVTGFVWFKIASKYNVRGYLALLIAIVAQASMFFWFAMTTFISVPMYLLASIACLLVLTRDNRCLLANYLFLTFTLSGIFITPHPAYLVGFVLPVIVVFLAEIYSDFKKQPTFGYPVIFTLAMFSSLILCAYRIFPVIKSLIIGGVTLSQMKWLNGYANDAYFGLSLFNPLALGIQTGNASWIAEMLGYPNIHNQMHNSLYFGIAPLIIVYLALRASGSRTIITLAAVTIAINLTCINAFEPISDVVNMIFFPINHTAIFRILSHFSFLFLFMFSVKEIPNFDKDKLKKGLRECLVGVGIIIICAMAFSGRLMSFEFYHHLTKLQLPVFIYGCRLVSLLVIGWIAYVCMAKINALTTRWFVTCGLIFACVVLVASYYLAINVRVTGHTSTIIILLSCLLPLFTCAWIAHFSIANCLFRHKITFTVGLVLAFFFFILFQVVTGYHSAKIWSSWLGFSVFIALSFVTIFVILQWSFNNISFNQLMIFLVIILLSDLISSYLNYAYVNICATSPYYNDMNKVYPDRVKLKKYFDREGEYLKETKQQNLLADSDFNAKPSSWMISGFGLKNKDVLFKNQSNSSVIDLYNEDMKVDGNFYQKVFIDESTDRLAFGAWVKAEKGTAVKLFITDLTEPSAGDYYTEHDGDGKWHWKSVSLESSQDIRAVRVKLNICSIGGVSIFGPKLVVGRVVMPKVRPPNTAEIITPNNALLENVDFQNYRLSHVATFNKIAKNELTAGFSIVYETPTYAGVDSDQPSDFVSFLGNFSKLDSSWWARFGLLSILKNNKELNLLGVGYDLVDGDEVFRPNAIPRFSAFSGFEIQDSRVLALQRLKDKSFDETKVVILSDPIDKIAPVYRRFEKLNYKHTNADQLKLKIASDTPRIILFNEHFSDDWHALWNGVPLTIIRANTIAMAVILPDGSGELVFDFKPYTFNLLVKVSIAMTILLSILLFIFLLIKIKNNTKKIRVC